MPWLWSPEPKEQPREELRIPLYEYPPGLPEVKKEEEPERGVRTWDI